MADWLENTARRLEFSEKEEWPDNALELAEVMYTAFSNVSQSTQDRGIATPMQFATKVKQYDEHNILYSNILFKFLQIPSTFFFFLYFVVKLVVFMENAALYQLFFQLEYASPFC